MGYFFSLSKSETESCLNWSEWALLIFGVVLVIGLLGEHKGIKSPKWKSREHVFSILVMLGVAGELLADGGIFGFGRQLQIIVDKEVAESNRVAAQANKDAKEAGLKLAEAQLELAEVKKKQEPRHISKEQHDKFVALWNNVPLKNPSLSVLVATFSGTPETLNLACEVRKMLSDSGFLEQHLVPFGVVGASFNACGVLATQNTPFPNADGSTLRILFSNPPGLDLNRITQAFAAANIDFTRAIDNSVPKGTLVIVVCNKSGF